MFLYFVTYPCPCCGKAVETAVLAESHEDAQNKFRAFYLKLAGGNANAPLDLWYMVSIPMGVLS